MTESAALLSPVGRMVQGHPMDKITKTMEGGVLLSKTTGQPREEYFFAVAFPKSDPLTAQLMQTLQTTAQAGFPGGQFNLPTFAWKVTDGDIAPNNAKEGLPGNLVFKFKSGFPPKVFTKGGQQQIVEPEQLKRGYFVRVYFTVSANGNSLKPGLYLNPQAVELVAFGEEITSGPDGSVFSQAPVSALPPGAMATPPAGTPLAFGAPPAFAPVPPVAPGIQPAPDFLNPPPPPVPARPQMTAKAAGQPYQTFKDAGWTDEQLRANGYMV